MDATASRSPNRRYSKLHFILESAKYSPGGGEITMQAGMAADQSAVEFRIRDHGLGMKPEQVRRVYERFYRADNSGHIPGTGMALVKEIMQIHGGTVAVESVFGEGTEVVLSFPVDVRVGGYDEQA